MSESNLSDFRIEPVDMEDQYEYVYPEEKVREAVQKLKDKICNCKNTKIYGDVCWACENIEEIFGPQLVGDKK